MSGVAFEHGPLPQNTIHVRLVQIIQYDNQGLHLSMTVWPAQDAPPYRAVSYTWGSPEEPLSQVRINGKLFAVRKNCHYTLWHVQLHYPKCYLWIDSICINQGDVSGKSAQTAKMWSIFNDAKEVLIRIGPHVDSSERLLQLDWMPESIRSLKHHLTVWVHDPPNSWAPDFLAGASCSTTQMVDLLKRYVTFSRRGYWKRTW
ncbi:hypothetical protein CLAFUW4_13993 [Fulvia fulva]|uniref:Heterokaryon incompatibility domain-containing protein n=1 Tax=Passalora fulva TaxID=5499 RepID=A0A9Q8PKK5_PASFU|nr:uncharacterized protein CLAFUR5_13831 [Fulvia fulva]KAK4610746.1 hypothetical protein CLAFUR4_13996 [Fulvia fulva]KAK4611115.1 hypothetical protein CLAFUR0_14000 [Fulvia fulva]UJO24140.1 hypothetical protein CLAFUR5_13831 [Fulvia fulva]WPV22194.1 hypothetical protein CLAFUW4_13993 [Fulvia fulva]WPV36950.1 hypothetical protein CLAFUW7_14001 [Fulvia fulva]